MRKTAIAVTLALALTAAAAFGADTASIVYTEGEVTMNGAPAVVGDNVPAGALIITAKDAVCQVVFNKRNIVHMAAGTTLRFDENALSRGATLKAGAIAMVLRNLAPAPAGELRFSIRTPTAVAGVRGTCFFVKVEDENDSYICACNGALRLEGEGGSFTQNLAASHHREVRVSRTAAGITVSAAPLEYHTDGDVETVAARIGETIDWTKIDR
jgi:hypothetical protein